MSHANARLTPAGRLLMVRRVEAPRPPCSTASSQHPASPSVHLHYDSSATNKPPQEMAEEAPMDPSNSAGVHNQSARQSHCQCSDVIDWHPSSISFDASTNCVP